MGKVVGSKVLNRFNYRQCCQHLYETKVASQAFYAHDATFVVCIFAQLTIVAKVI